MIRNIVSRQNPRLRSLLSHREEFAFFEGEKLVRDILQENIRISLLITTDAEVDVTNCQGRVDEIWRVTPSVMKKISELKEPSRFIAVLQFKPSKIDARQIKLAVILHDIQDPTNVGTVFRCAAAFDASAVLLTGHSINPNNSKFLRVAQNAVFSLPFQKESLESAIRRCTGAGLNLYLTAAGPDHRCVRIQDVRQPAVIVFGNEGQGLPGDLLSRHPVIRLDHSDQIDSLNVGVSACIMMHALYARQ